MTSKELKVRDWVSYKGNNYLITDTSDNNIVSITNPNNYELLDAKELEPIKIIDKILENNGWEFKEGAYTKCYKDFNNIYLVSRNFTGFSTLKSWAVSIGEEYIYTIYYVHELQHFLWALGENDNLKV